ncbi:MAG: hypothetical protein LAO06_19225 [Acidobacteriia bacterium]|nr:hypothetical protein [Terriglobia bacterium]
MRLASVFLYILCVLSVETPAVAQSRPRPEVLPDGALRQVYYYQLQPPAKGTPPWRWNRVRGALPPGIALKRNGILAGAPTAPGEYRFSLEAMDSAPRPVVQTRDYILTVPSPITIVWTQAPQLTDEGAIAGEVQVTNGTGRAVDLTVIVVAVNTINKAFALGYQRVSLGPGSQLVPFSSTLPPDTYVVHADAIAEIAATGEIYRARLQTGSLTVP